MMGRRPDRERQHKAVELRQAGLSFAEIGQRPGVTKQRAHQLAGFLSRQGPPPPGWP